MYKRIVDPELKALLFPEFWWENKPKSCKLCGRNKPNLSHAINAHGLDFVDFDPAGRPVRGMSTSGEHFVIKKIKGLPSSDLLSLRTAVIASLMSSSTFRIQLLEYQDIGWRNPLITTIIVADIGRVKVSLHRDEWIYEISSWDRHTQLAKYVEKILDKAVWRRGGRVALLSRSKKRLRKQKAVLQDNWPNPQD